MTQEQIKARRTIVKYLVEQGVDTAEIARRLGCTRDVVTSDSRALGIYQKRLDFNSFEGLKIRKISVYERNFGSNVVHYATIFFNKKNESGQWIRKQLSSADKKKVDDELDKYIKHFGLVEENSAEQMQFEEAETVVNDFEKAVCSILSSVASDISELKKIISSLI